MKFTRFLRLHESQNVAFVGAGGKTSAMFRAATELGTSLVTTTTHIAKRQADLANQHTIVVEDDPHPAISPCNGVSLLTGSLDGERYRGLGIQILSWELAS